MLKLFFVAVSAYIFCDRYFTYAAEALARPVAPKRYTLGMFIINYTVFILCSILHFHLIINWTLLFALLFAETLPLFHRGLLPSCLLALQGTLIGLNFNMLSRCLITLMLDVPLDSGNNHTLQAGNIKLYPVLVGFLLAAVVFQVYLRRGQIRALRLVMRSREHLRVFLWMVSILYVYLSLNLLLYSSGANLLLLKLWGIKSSAFVAVGYQYSLWYTIRMCRLSQYRKQNEKMRIKVHNQRRETEGLRSLAYRDSLTGLFNRQYAQQCIKELWERDASFCLCFIDLNGLKHVNDRIGHSAGDEYLLAAAQEIGHVLRRGTDHLFRYGGDEFIVLMPGCTADQAEKKLREADRMLRACSNTAAYPFALSFSFGVACSDDAAEPNDLVQTADRKMYLHKMYGVIGRTRVVHPHSRVGSGG